MRVLMFGWEFPPFNSGGLGTACLGLTKGLATHGVHVNFVIPKAPKGMQPKHNHVDLTVASRVKETISFETETSNSHFANVEFDHIETLIKPYMTEEEYLVRYADVLRKSSKGKAKYSMHLDDESDEDAVYGKNLYHEVFRYTQKAKSIATQKEFDIIHAHDWMAYKAGISAKQASGKPLVLHIHATEFDRTGGNVNQVVYDIEREGFHAADKIMAVSELTRNTVISKYGVPEEKVCVVHNAVEHKEKEKLSEKDEKMVLFLGRITIQKGPEYFVEAAAKTAQIIPDAKFVVAGTGDMEARMKEHAQNLGVADKMEFTGFLRGKQIDEAYQKAQLYVMPSVSEPFGITPLESMRNGTPTLISKTSGVSEVVKHALKVDFWDVNQMASKMVAVLQYPTLCQELTDNGEEEVHTFNWDIPAEKCVNVYNNVLRGEMN